MNRENLNLYQRMLPFGKRLLDVKGVYAGKKELSQILHMLMGFRTSWAARAWVVKEEQADYGMGSGVDKARDKENPLENPEAPGIFSDRFSRCEGAKVTGFSGWFVSGRSS